MKASNFLISTLKEAPVDAEIISHKLMLRAGMIKKISSGLYSYLPLGLRILKKVENIVREEMDKSGALEVLMPVIQPANLWQETGRFDSMGTELLRFKDRHDRDFIIQPTSEEVVTEIARSEFKSYKNLSKNLYQIQTKFRDEIRPRFGLMRAREFIMKDAYSFDKNHEMAQKSYEIMRQTYKNIFDRFGLNYRIVKADSGAIGGDLSEEFQVIAKTGEDAIIYCPNSDYAANIEKATSLKPEFKRPNPSQKMEKFATPNNSTCEAVANQLNLPLKKTIKSLVLATEENRQVKIWLLLLRGDHFMNEVKVRKIIGLENFRFATIEEIIEYFGCEPGFLGPINTKKEVNLVVDFEVNIMSDLICGANEKDFHIKGINFGRDLPEPKIVADLRNVVEGDLSPDGEGELKIERGIEIGHIFYLGAKYSKLMNANFLDEKGKTQNFEMGCYGIGISRLPASAIEQNHDDKGIIWPNNIAPFEVVICPIGFNKSKKVKIEAENLYQKLLNLGIDVILDDRDLRPGNMFADWELIGVPHRITLGEKSLNSEEVEYQARRDNQATNIEITKIMAFIQGKLSE